VKNCVYHQLENTATFELCTDVLTAKDKGAETPHFHKNFEILLVTRGECHCEIGDERLVLQEGEAAFILPFQIHGVLPAEGGEVRRVSLHDHLIWSLASALDEKMPKQPKFVPPLIVRGFFADQLYALYGTKEVKIRRIPAEQRMMVKGCLYIMGSAFLEQAELVPSRSADALMTTVVQYIADHFKNDISLKDVAKETGYSYHHLSRMFNRIFGINFKSMLNQYRLEYAYSMLQDTRLPVSQIAFESGFQSIRSLDHVCREMYGRSPSEMRKAHYV
jgi:AraC-like DNA-binding protein